VALLRAERRPETEIGSHGHHKPGMGIANSLAVMEGGDLTALNVAEERGARLAAAEASCS
jgi:hypothetical protein